MPLFQQSPNNKNVLQATSGLPTYLLGSLNRTAAPTRMRVTAVASSGATFTYTVTVIEGNLPVVGQLVSVSGCAVNSQFNVTNAKIASVSFVDVPEDGIGTFTVTQAGTFVPQTPEVGFAIAPQIETAETILSLSPSGASFASREVSLQDNTGPDNLFTIRAIAIFPVLPGAATVVIQTADLDIDSDFQTAVTVAVVAGGVLPGGGNEAGVVLTGLRVRFARFLVSGIAGYGSASIIGKVLI